MSLRGSDIAIPTRTDRYVEPTCRKGINPHETDPLMAKSFSLVFAEINLTSNLYSWEIGKAFRIMRKEK